MADTVVTKANKQVVVPPVHQFWLLIRIWPLQNRDFRDPIHWGRRPPFPHQGIDGEAITGRPIFVDAVSAMTMITGLCPGRQKILILKDRNANIRSLSLPNVAQATFILRCFASDTALSLISLTSEPAYLLRKGYTACVKRGGSIPQL